MLMLAFWRMDGLRLALWRERWAWLGAATEATGLMLVVVAWLRCCRVQALPTRWSGLCGNSEALIVDKMIDRATQVPYRVGNPRYGKLRNWCYVTYRK